ncbi:MAG TPA: cell wall anchor protein, partial [Prevotella sp.]|nr:cell wall anchor protein [Prevotella sp.]
ATIAYQNALVWKITGNTANASHAVSVLMQWANTTKGISGDSNYALAAG